jgi:hypothetical protein
MLAGGSDRRISYLVRRAGQRDDAGGGSDRRVSTIRRNRRPEAGIRKFADFLDIYYAG